MTSQEVLDGLTNDLVLQRMKKFFIAKGLPDGQYLLDDACLEQEADESPYRGKLQLSNENVVVVIKFDCSQLAENLKLDIQRTKTPIRRKDKLVYTFTGVLRPEEEAA